ncbi:MAG: LysE family translocator [Rhodospirillales bacterium]|nr:LysE family translocator [Rhodospirillales bacterium]
MDPIAWLQVALVCAMGAISPGPSLAVVLRNTLAGGKRQGVLTGIGHGLGILIYAGLVVTGLAVVLHAFPAVEALIGYGGVALLIWLGLSFIGVRPPRTATGRETASPTEPTRHRGGFAAGFLIAFLNPKITAFFMAVFAPFIRLDANGAEKAILALTAGIIDAGWYVLVALALSGTGLIHVLRRHAKGVDRAIGALLLVLAAGLLYRML